MSRELQNFRTEQRSFLPFQSDIAAKKTSFADVVLGRQTGRLTLKRVRAFSKLDHQEKKHEAHASSPFVFCDKSTGATRFKAESTGDSDFSIERIAGLLAMQCLVRGHEPEDFLVLVPAEQMMVERMVSRAKEILEEGRAISGPPNLSPRQKEILHSVIGNRANKEIASKLNITVRTVKFHISSLLDKFAVENRSELAQRASGMFRPAVLEREALEDDQTSIDQRRRELSPVPMHSNLRLTSKSRSVRFPGRVLTA
jgi:DNA-binding CsgD family transcriptional regulator